MNLDLSINADEAERQTEMDDYFEGEDLEIILLALQELESVIKEDKSDSQEINEEVLLKIKTIQEAAKKYNVDFRSPKGVKPTHEIKKLFIEVLEKYSMLSMVDRNSWGHRWDSKSSKNVLNYINVIDVCNSSQGGK